MHTLKGAARAAGVLDLESLCHLLESDLARARETKAPLGGAAIALLFEAADALSDARDRLGEGKSLAGGPIETVLEHARGRGEPRPVARVSGAVAVVAPSVELPPSAVPTRSSTEPVRDELVRVGLHHVDAISNAAGEVTSLAAVLDERADDLSALRLRVRSARARPEHREDKTLADVEREITRLLRRAGDDARSLGSVSGRLSGTARRLRQRSLRELTETLPRVVRDVAHDVSKEVRLVITGDEVEADRIVASLDAERGRPRAGDIVRANGRRETGAGNDRYCGDAAR
jgi:chemotaxis protein histidine kinase CheA